jgi:hypothetical protein
MAKANENGMITRNKSRNHRPKLQQKLITTTTAAQTTQQQLQQQHTTINKLK